MNSSSKKTTSNAAYLRENEQDKKIEEKLNAMKLKLLLSPSGVIKVSFSELFDLIPIIEEHPDEPLLIIDPLE